MTTAPSLLHSAMEIPAGEDLEMASPYQGQTDDFDIDIDLMEDQDHASNMDSDMMGADDFPNASQQSLFQNEVTDDADMVDEPSEGSMVDAEDLPDGDNDIDVHFEEVTYEADMLEGEHDEPVDAILPTVFVEAPTAAESEIKEPTQVTPETNEPIENEQEVHDLVAKPIILEDEKQISPNEEQNLTLETSKAEDDQTEQVQPSDVPEQPSLEHDQNEESKEQTNEVIENEEPAANMTKSSDSSAENLEAPEPSSAKSEDVNAESHETHASHETEHHDSHDEFHDETLHPVKVIYQDNEISLFPPLEGDSAETFFLHDEDTAYDNFDKLFESLRDVLLDNIGEHDVLVIDIDSLGIQITEDSSYTSRFTLHQIMDIYLRLCHNDENHHPDALYLNLSTKQAVHAELAGLDSAAKEGKGLSQIHLWADYDEAEEEPAAEETADNDKGHGEETHSQTVQQSQSIHEDAVAIGEAPHEIKDSNEPANATVDASQEPTVEHHDATDEASHVPNAAQVDGTFQGMPDNEDYPEVNAEDPKAESTSTAAPNSEAPAIIAQPGDSSAVEVPNDVSTDYTAQGANQDHEHDEFDDKDGSPEADNHEEVDLAIHQDAYDDYNEAEAHDVGNEEASNNQELAEEEPHDGAEAPEANIDDNLYEESESTLENAPHDDRSSEQTPDPEDDLLGIADDLLQTPPKDRHGETENSEGFHEDNPEDELPGPTFDDGVDHQQLADDDYHHDPGLDVNEETELGEIDPFSTDSQNLDNLSVKRSREEEDEWDITESTTPDLKRRRPS